MIDLKLTCVITENRHDEGFGVSLLINGCDSRAKAEVIAGWIRSSLMGNLQELGQMTGGGIAVRVPPEGSATTQ